LNNNNIGTGRQKTKGWSGEYDGGAEKGKINSNSTL
jgi:hypothetical protein